jgi:transposase
MTKVSYNVFMRNKKCEIILTPKEKAKLLQTVKTAKSPQRMVLRSKIILKLAGGGSKEEIARELGTTRQTILKWKKRYVEERLEGIKERKRSGRKAYISEQVKQRIILGAINSQERMSCRRMAFQVGVSKDTVQRIWRKNEIKPHLLRTFKLSNDPHFEAKFWDVIGIYLNPPEQAIVMCCDEKTQIQALERTQPGLPLGIGHIRTKTHDYYRHGTITLFAALNYLTGKIISRMENGHTHKDWLRFLKQIERNTPKGVDIHIILDNYCTHKHKDVVNWINKHKRFHMHYTPTSSSWMNLVERFFGEITDEVIRRGSFSSIKELTDSIFRYLARRNEAPKRYTWRADGQKILEKIARARQVSQEGNR